MCSLIGSVDTDDARLTLRCSGKIAGNVFGKQGCKDGLRIHTGEVDTTMGNKEGIQVDNTGSYIVATNGSKYGLGKKQAK